MSEPKLRFTRQLPKHDFGLLKQMASQAYDSQDFDCDKEEEIRKQWEDMVKRLSRQQLRVESVNYNLFRETKLNELTNKTA
jgi:Asp-tRNA(Asn)/Glu-tRNA(Gln) amidotransferase A subunit family amidase